MKNQLLIFIIIPIFFWRCQGKEKNCNEFVVDEAPTQLRKYFDIYTLNQSVLYRSKDKFDTIKIVSVIIDTSYLKDPRTCAIPTSKEIIFKSKYFSSGNPIAYRLRSTNFMTCYTKDTLLKDKKDIIFQVDYDINDSELKNSNTIVGNKVQLLDSFRIQNTIFREVLRLDAFNTGLSKTIFYFAPQKGLIRWENSNDTFNIQN